MVSQYQFQKRLKEADTVLQRYRAAGPPNQAYLSAAKNLPPIEILPDDEAESSGDEDDPYFADLRRRSGRDVVSTGSKPE
ncbi:hypothetical protein HK104_001559 [Borealophlyctis nickersoniae]|nr:hypothetical protein HK104_001559 [Borealophlyctis nickersoniae]